MIFLLFFLITIPLIFCHEFTIPSKSFLEQLIQTIDNDVFWQNVERLSVERQVGTEEHAKVQSFIKQHFSSEFWQFEQDSFESETPHGTKQFTNLIFTEKSKTSVADEKFLILSAHYDSKFFKPPLKFIGSTDSSVPCAILLSIVKTIQPFLNEFKNNNSTHISVKQNSNHFLILLFFVGNRLKIVFFDGEEAFE
jgi:glutaminyl-peptide cyclotransferase